MHLERNFEHLSAECLTQQHLIKQQQSRIESLEKILGKLGETAAGEAAT
jgi:hypothetical protein